jgi:C1A family cysteine protease
MIAVEADHSGQLGAVRHQGKRPTCLAFAASDLNSFSNSTEHLSVEYLCHHAAKLTSDWHPGLGFTADVVLAAVAAPGQPHEHKYPYSGDDHNAPLRVPAPELGPLVCSATKARGLQVADVIDAVSAGEVVGIIVAVTVSLFHPKLGIVDFDENVLPGQYHAMLAVGVGTHKDTGESFVLVRNSWGAGWGVGGHAWISQKHLALHLHEGFRA